PEYASSSLGRQRPGGKCSEVPSLAVYHQPLRPSRDGRVASPSSRSSISTIPSPPRVITHSEEVSDEPPSLAAVAVPSLPVASSESVPTVGVVVPSGGSSVLVDVPVSLLLREVLASLTVLSLVSGAVVRLLEVTGGVVLAVGSNDEPGRSSQSTGPSFTHWLKPQHHTPRTSAC